MSTPIESPNKKLEIDFNSAKLLKLINDGCQKINLKINDKNIVLVIGNTGAGKSTLVNYLIGHRIIISDRNGSKIANIDNQGINKEHAKIGQNPFVSETLFPEAFFDDKTDIFYCDCPGFLDNRGYEERIAISVNLEMAVRNANSIKAIIVTINHSELFAARGDNFKQLYKILDKLVDIERCSKSIIIVVTRCPDKNYKVEDFVTQLQLIKGDSKKRDLQSIILENKNNILIGDLSTNKLKESIQTIHSRTNAIEKKFFNFTSYDESRILFNQFINQSIYHALINLRICVVYPIEITTFETKINETKNKIIYQMKEKKQLSNMAVNKDKNSLLDEYNNSLKEKDENLKKLIKDCENLESQINKYTEEKRLLDSDKPFLIKSFTFTEKRGNVLGKYSCSKKVFKYFDPETPILKVEKSCKNGEFKSEKKDFENGFYSVKYKSFNGQDGVADVSIYTMEKNSKEIQNRIKYLDDYILKDLIEKRDENRKLQSILNSELNQIRKIIENVNEDIYDDLDKHLKEQTEIDHLEKEINQLTEKKTLYEQNLKKAEDYLKNEQESIIMLKFLVITLKLNSIMSQEFIRFYDEYLECSKGNRISTICLTDSKENIIYFDLTSEKSKEDLLKRKNELINKLKDIENLIKEKKRESETIEAQLAIIDNKLEEHNKLINKNTNHNSQTNDEILVNKETSSLNQIKDKVEKPKSNISNLINIFDYNSANPQVKTLNKIDTKPQLLPKPQKPQEKNVNSGSSLISKTPQSVIKNIKPSDLNIPKSNHQELPSDSNKSDSNNMEFSAKQNILNEFIKNKLIKRRQFIHNSDSEDSSHDEDDKK